MSDLQDPPPGLPGRGNVVLAAGVGVTGLPVVRLLLRLGCRVLATANRTPPAELFELADGADGARGADGAHGAVGTDGTVTFLGDPQELPSGPDAPDLVVTSAGIPPHHPLLAAAYAAGIDVIGEVELAWRLDHAGAAGAGAGAGAAGSGAAGPSAADSGAEHAPRDWLVVTGTNGKTTTIGMLAAMLRSGGKQVTASGNVGWPVLEAVLAGSADAGSLPDRPAKHQAAPGRQDVVAAELSSFQLHYAPSLHPTAGLVLNLAEDHLDWHGSMAGYAADKARALTGDVAVAVVDDPGAAALLAQSPAPLRVGVTLGEPAPGQIGVTSGGVVGSRNGDSGGVVGSRNQHSGSVVENAVAWPHDAAPAERELFAVADLPLPGDHNLSNAIAAAALARAVGVPPEAIAAAVRELAPGAHRNEPVATVVLPGGETAGGTVTFVNDSKATNPHAAAASLLAYPRVVWLAGGQLKGASVDELVRQVADRLAGVVLFGVDAPLIAQALRRHAPDVPRIELPSNDDETMQRAVSAAWQLATAAGGWQSDAAAGGWQSDAAAGEDAPEVTEQPRDSVTVLLAPTAASLDMFASYAARGEAFAAAARQLAGQVGR
ncbi:Mur ligase family protein [Nakamurella aerolata]|uniref:Mur ligase family protein n=1 Tax=Nakamurella aerolata TaxID=1656892 RepID=UPI001FE44F99|nr:UDP-N-acetylmuramoyl-L-alanine--D-glutamate ligase [Nakamurella aerolata]